MGEVKDEYKPQCTIVVFNEPTERLVGPIRIMPWKTFCAALWAGEIIS